MRILAWVGLLLAVLAATPAGAGPGVLRVGSSGDYAPFSLAGQAGWEGFDVAVARAYAEERGLALEFVPFRWPRLLANLAANRFDVAMSGITVRPGRSLAGRFSVPVAETGAVVLVRGVGSFDSLDELDQRRVRIGVNAGGHLEQVARARFRHATLVFIPENLAVREALLGHRIQAALTDTLEAPSWRSGDPDLDLLGPFTRDRKAYLVRTDRPQLAADLDRWLLAREADGSLRQLRRSHFGEVPTPATATPLEALLAASDERLALMPWVGAAKREAVLPIEDRAREEKVVTAGLHAVRQAAKEAGRPGPAEEAVRAFYAAQIEAAKAVQMASGRDPEFAPPEPVPELESELRPALLRIGERMAALLVALPSPLDDDAVQRAAREELRARWLPEAARRSLADAIVRVANTPTSPPVENTPPSE